MLIQNETGPFISPVVTWPGGPGIWETSGPNNQVVTLERLGGDGVSWVPVGELAEITGNGVVAFDLDKSQVRARLASGIGVFADITTRRYSP